MPRRTVIVFTSQYASAAVTEHVEAIAERFPDWQVVVLQQIPPRNWGVLLRSKLRSLAQKPVSYPLELLAKLWRLSVVSLMECVFGRPRRTLHTVWLPDPLSEMKLTNVFYHRCRYLHSALTLEQVRQLKPWLGISIGAPILRPKLFTIPDKGTVNIHKSLLPDYRGMPPGFWELNDRSPISGVSVHWVVEDLDSGDLICQQPLAIPPYSTPEGLAAQLDVLGTEVLLQALEKIDAGQAAGQSQESKNGELHRNPPCLLALRVRRRCWHQRRSRRTGLLACRDFAKSCILAAYAYVWAPLRNYIRSLCSNCHVSVLLYHRVDDTFLDDVTVGVEQFANHLKILQRHYEILDLPTFLASRGEPRKRPAVVITFDDGYACNYLAAVLLRRCGLPATFFVSTGMIDTQQAFPYDAERLGYRVPAISWSQVEKMVRWGFHFGSHTVNHARLSTLTVKGAQDEIMGAIRELQDHIGNEAVVDCFAYPYGRETDINETIRESLQEIGIRYCLSAYGGVNQPDWNPRDILRCGVDASFTDIGFRAVVEGWHVRSG